MLHQTKRRMSSDRDQVAKILVNKHTDENDSDGGVFSIINLTLKSDYYLYSNQISNFDVNAC